jgi:hypothetical protein
VFLRKNSKKNEGMKTFFPKSKHLIINVLLRKQLKTTYVRQFELRIYICIYIYTHLHTQYYYF